MISKLRLLAASLVLTLGCADDGAEDEDTGSNTSPTESMGSDTQDSSELGCAAQTPNNTSDGASDPIMETWGAACSTDDDCVALLGEGAICAFEAVIYELPGGYCTKPCSLPDSQTRVVENDPACDPDGGVACIGQKPLFERCAILCTDDAQCNRDGYYCRQMPMISQPEDPPFCLMPDCCQDTCEE